MTEMVAPNIWKTISEFNQGPEFQLQETLYSVLSKVNKHSKTI